MERSIFDKNISNDKIIKDICEYLHIDEPDFQSDNIIENVKEICVARLCESMGLKCTYNFKNDYFDLFAMITGEAVCNILNIHMHIADDSIRLIRYEKINFVQYVTDLFDNEEIDTAVIDAFNFANEYKYAIPSLAI